MNDDGETAHAALREFASGYVIKSSAGAELLRAIADAVGGKQYASPLIANWLAFVWQRDRGQCVKCGSRERLEFDHIIPLVAGGSSTERNIQLLCETCNRSKGATV